MPLKVGPLDAVLPQAAPTLGNDNAVAWIPRIVANLQRLIQTPSGPPLRQLGYILRAVVGHAREPVAVDEHLGRDLGRLLAAQRTCVDQNSVGDASHGRKAIPAPALHLLCRRPARAHIEP